MHLANSPRAHRPRWMTQQSLHLILHIPHLVLGLGRPFARHMRMSVRSSMPCARRKISQYPALVQQVRQPLVAEWSERRGRRDDNLTQSWATSKLRHLSRMWPCSPPSAFLPPRPSLPRLPEHCQWPCSPVYLRRRRRLDEDNNAMRCGCGERYVLSAAESCRSSVAVPWLMRIVRECIASTCGEFSRRMQLRHNTHRSRWISPES
jgi:hypothetical protein